MRAAAIRLLAGTRLPPREIAAAGERLRLRRNFRREGRIL